MLIEIILVLLCILFLVLSISTFIMSDPTETRNCFYYSGTQEGKEVEPYWDRKGGCNFIQEKIYLPTQVPKPKGVLKLSKLITSAGSPNSNICKPVKYAYKFVRLSDGAYGDLSDWSYTVKSCGCSLITQSKDSCYNGDCSKVSTDCTANLPSLRNSIPYKVDDTQYIANVYRCYLKDDGSIDTSTIQQVGVLNMKYNTGLYEFTDVNYPMENKSGCSKEDC